MRDEVIRGETMLTEKRREMRVIVPGDKIRQVASVVGVKEERRGSN